jgi:hypothetical protein
MSIEDVQGYTLRCFIYDTFKAWKKKRFYKLSAGTDNFALKLLFLILENLNHTIRRVSNNKIIQPTKKRERDGERMKQSRPTNTPK